MKGQKGITLVALIITIIVMLILVAVSITVAIDGGLFDKAEQAGQDYKDAAEDEAAGRVFGNETTVNDVIDRYKPATAE
jgi:hypothetical protein